MNEIPNWMEKYIPAMLEQWTDNIDKIAFIHNENPIQFSDIKTYKGLKLYRNTLSEKSYGFPNKHTFDINMNIKIDLLEILNRDFKMDK